MIANADSVVPSLASSRSSPGMRPALLIRACTGLPDRSQVSANSRTCDELSKPNHTPESSASVN